jgi:enoyl-CoA hydratase/carnithine racemase
MHAPSPAVSVVSVRVVYTGPVAELVLDSAPVNALTSEFLQSWNAALDSLAGVTRSVLVRSELPGTFMAGGDLALLDTGSPAELADYVTSLQRAFTRLAQLPVPVVCLVEGHCLGGGLELALAADIIVATSRATFGFPEARLGILPAAGGVHRLVRRVGEGTSRRLMLTGQRIDAARAHQLGVVDDLVEADGGLDHTRALAVDLAGLPNAAVTAIKQLTNTALDRTLDEGLAAEWTQWQAIRATAETHAALRAASERGSRKPEERP